MWRGNLRWGDDTGVRYVVVCCGGACWFVGLLVVVSIMCPFCSQSLPPSAPLFLRSALGRQLSVGRHVPEFPGGVGAGFRRHITRGPVPLPV